MRQTVFSGSAALITVISVILASEKVWEVILETQAEERQLIAE